MTTAYYRVSVYHQGDTPEESGRWVCRVAKVRKWTLRRWLKKLYGESWSRETILVERHRWLEDWKLRTPNRTHDSK